MEIEEIKKKYPERKKRDRRWFTYEEALIATQNNAYIQEAIRLSSISPTYKPSIEQQKSPKKTPLLSPTLTPSTSSSTATSADNTSTESLASSEIPVNQKSKSGDAFKALTRLMETAEISP